MFQTVFLSIIRSWRLHIQQQAYVKQLLLDCVWNVMAHAQKPDFVFRRNGRVHLNRRGRQFSRRLAAEVCASAVVMLDIPCSDVVWRVLATHSIRQFPFTSPPVRHRVPSHFNWTLRASSGNKMEMEEFHLVPASKQVAVSVWHMPVAVCTVLNSWWWTERPSETYRVLYKNK
jgi:hypothetical protein